jgi:DedD protein
MAEGRERTIGSGHLVALFLGIVVLCCVFFILGYEMGRAQFERGGAATAAAKPATSTPTTAAQPAASPAPGWPSGSSASGAAANPPAASASAAAAAKAPPSAPAAHAASSKNIDAAGLKAPEIPKGSIILQVAANRSESDALGLAKLLQDKGYPAFVLTPAGDDWYRVQVGPFADAKSADQAKTGLAKEGFKAIVKH